MLHLVGDANRFTHLPKGVINLNILKMVPRDLSAILSTAINKVRSENIEVIYKNIQIALNGTPEAINIIVKPFICEQNSLSIIIVFEAAKHLTTPQAVVESIDIHETLRTRIKELENELTDTQAMLQKTMEEMDTSNEELQSANEELMATNEELQSTVEELHSVNEELITVNAQLAEKIDELTEVNNDMSNFLSSANIGTIFLDKKLLIRKFTPAIQKDINLIDFDIGRPIYHISHNLKKINLVTEAQDIIKGMAPKTLEVESTNGSWYILRLLPYLTDTSEIRGVVITLVDTTELKKMSEALHKLSRAIDQSSTVVLITDFNGHIEYVNANFTNATGYSISEALGNTPSLLKSGYHQPDFYKSLWDTLKQGKDWKGEICNKKKNGDLYWELTSISPVKNTNNEITHFITVKDDITQQKKMLEVLRSTEFFSSLSHELKTPLNVIFGIVQLFEKNLKNTGDIEQYKKTLSIFLS